VVKNGATLTLIDKQAMFLFTVEANLDQPGELSALVFIDCQASGPPRIVDLGWAFGD
jgi:hypothetical protein